MSAQTTTDTTAESAPTAAPVAAPIEATNTNAHVAAPAEAQPSAADAAEPKTLAPAPTPEAPEAQQKTENAVPAAQKTEGETEGAPSGPVANKPAEKIQTPLTSLFEKLPGILESSNHKEMWGVQLSDDSHVPTTVILQKFLRANDNDVSKASEQLQKALEWRRDVNPSKLLDEVSFDKSRFDNVGYVTTHKDAQGKETVITWNIYGAVKDKKATFGDVDGFINWRAALMELSIRKLNLANIETPIPDGGDDPYQMIQVHDYLNISFLRMDPAVKKVTTQIIPLFAMAYPEVLSNKFFVNIPALMGWVFKAMKVFLAPKTIAKFHPLSYGSELANEIAAVKESLPKEYGGSAESIKVIGETVKLGDETVPAAEVKSVAETPAPASAATESKAVDIPAPAAAAAVATSAETGPAAADPDEKAGAPKAEPEVPTVADLSIKDQPEGKEAAKEETKPAAA